MTLDQNEKLEKDQVKEILADLESVEDTLETTESSDLHTDTNETEFTPTESEDIDTSFDQTDLDSDENILLDDDQPELDQITDHSETINQTAETPLTIDETVNEQPQELDQTFDETINNKSISEKTEEIADARPAGLNPFKSDEDKPTVNPEKLDPALVENQEDLMTLEGYDHLPEEVFAGFFPRLIAFTIDSLLIFLIKQILTNSIGPISTENFWGLLPLIFNIGLYCCYFLVSNLSLKGQTPGKILCDLQVVPLNSTDQSLSFSAILIREFFGRIICYFAPWLALVSFFNDKHQHPIDMLTDTTVINRNYLKALAKWQLN